METKGIIGVILGFYGDYRVYILGLYWDNGKENGDYYIGLYKVIYIYW